MGLEILNIGFIGGGNMAQAIVGGLLRAGHPAARIAVAEPGEIQRQRVAALGAVRLTQSNPDVARTADVLVLAVKPQVMAAVLAEVGAVHRPAGQLVLSVAAGVTLATLTRALGDDVAAVRVMPNQPALIGAGMAVLVASPQASQAQREQAAQVAASTGRAVWIDDESLMDAVTAVSGSGPAYFYLLIELMEDAAVDLGLPRDVARTLVRQTAMGAAQMAGDPATDVPGLRAAVTSPGGTTAAALAIMQHANLSEIVRRALTAARDRGIELGRSP